MMRPLIKDLTNSKPADKLSYNETMMTYICTFTASTFNDCKFHHNKLDSIFMVLYWFSQVTD
jgi:hypothetical protein